MVTTYEGYLLFDSAKQSTKVANEQSKPCDIDFRALEPEPLPEGLSRKLGPVRLW